MKSPHLFVHLLAEPLSNPKWNTFFDFVADHFDELDSNSKGIVSILVGHHTQLASKTTITIAGSIAAVITVAITLLTTHAAR